MRARIRLQVVTGFDARWLCTIGIERLMEASLAWDISFITIRTLLCERTLRLRKNEKWSSVDKVQGELAMKICGLRKMVWIGVLPLAIMFPLQALANETVTTVSTTCSGSMGTCTVTTTVWVKYPDGSMFFVSQSTVTVPYVRPNPTTKER